MEAALKGPAYRIHTNRLVLRCPDPEDVLRLMAAIEASLDHLRAWMDWAMKEPENLEAKIERLRRSRADFDLGKDFTYRIMSRDETKLIGAAGLHPRIGEGALEIGYWIHKDHINQGLATEASAALTKAAVEIERVRRVEIRCDPQNLASAAVPRKLGYVHEATLAQQALTPDGKPRDTALWRLLADDYPASPSAKAEIEAFDVLGRRLL